MNIESVNRLLIAGGLATVLVVALLAVSMDFQGAERDGVPNCWNKSTSCSYQEINTTLDSCNSWYVTNPVEDLECSRTTEGVEEVSLITDPGNHVRGEMTEAEMETEAYDPGIRGQTDLEFLPDGRKLVSDHHGNLHILDDREVQASFSIEDQVDNEAVMANSDIGIKGIAVDPDYGQNRDLYMYYSMSNISGGYAAQNTHSAWKFRVSRFSMDGGEPVFENHMVNISGAYWHSGGGVEFGPDDKLYVTLGEANEPAWSQDMDRKRGKILRINRDGTVPDDNPFEDSYIYSLGHRNPQGIAWNPENGNTWASEHGNKRQDEINVIEAGGNYGWGRYVCGEIRDSSIELGPGEHIEPVRCFSNWTIAPSRMTFVDEQGHPWYGDLFQAGLRGKHLRKFEVSNGEIEDEEIFYFREESPIETGVARRIRDVEFHEGSLWLLGDIGRVEPAGGIIKLTPAN